MATIELELTEDTLNSARRSAEAGHVALEQWLTKAIQHAALATPAEDSVLGLFADAPELMDSVADEAMRAREQQNWRGEFMPTWSERSTRLPTLSDALRGIRQ